MADELLLDEEEKEDQSQPGSPDQDDRCHQRVYRHPVQTEEERMEAVRIIVTCARHLLGLVNDVLDFEKIESRQLDLEAIPFDVEKEADLVTSMLAFPAASTHVRIEKQMRLAHRTRVGDPLRFRQVLFNLLSNAIKFTPAEGTVTLSIHDEDEDEDGGNGNESGSDDCENSASRSKLRVEVRDTGIGISETAMKNLFKVRESSSWACARNSVSVISTLTHICLYVCVLVRHSTSRKAEHV
jgi:signal transduction histidine kinase